MDEFEGETVKIVIVFQWILVCQKLDTLPLHDFNIMVEWSLVILDFTGELLLLNLDQFLKFFHKQFHFELHLNSQIVQPVLQLFVEHHAFLEIKFDKLWLTAAHSPLVNELDGLGLVSDDRSHPLDRIA